MTTTVLGSEGSGQSSEGTNQNAGNPAGGAGTGAQGGNTNTGGAASWRDSLPEEIRNNPSISSFKDVAALTQSFIHAQSTIGKKGVIVPGDKATDEDWQNFYKGLGVPEGEKYTIEPPKDAKVDEKFMGWFKGVAAKNGMLPRQASALLAEYHNLQTSEAVAQAKAAQEQTTKAISGLKTEWGDAFDRNLGAIKFFLKEKAGEETAQAIIKDPAVSNNPTYLKLFLEAAKLMGEDKWREGGVGNGGGAPGEIRAQIAEIMGNGDKNGYFDRNHPMHQSMVDKVASLNRKLTGGK